MTPVQNPKACVLHAEIGMHGMPGSDTYLGEIRYQLERAFKRLTFTAEGFQGRLKKRGDGFVPAAGPEAGTPASPILSRRRGDYFVQIVFPDAERAILAACEMRFRMSTLTPASGSHLNLRVGCEYGRVHESAEEAWGETADMAQHLAKAAEAGQILTTRRMAVELPPGVRQALGQVKVSAMPDEVLMEIRCEALAANRGAEMPAPFCLRLEQGAKHFLVDADSGGVRLGRDPACELVVDNPKASRRHAWIGQRDGKFLLVDNSSNGTYISFGDGAETLLKHAELALSGRGRIAFGHAAAEAPEDSFTFEVRA